MAIYVQFAQKVLELEYHKIKDAIVVKLKDKELSDSNIIKYYNSLCGLFNSDERKSHYVMLFAMHCFFPALHFVKKDSLDEWTEKNIQSRRISEKDESIEDTYLMQTAKENKFSIAPLEINGLEAYHVIPSDPPSDEYQIYFCGNAQDAKDLMENNIYNHLYGKQRKNLIFWNYPSVGQSKSISHPTSDDFANAGFAFVEYCTQQGIKAENITLYGFSIGGAIGAKVARIAHEQKIPVKLIIERSFASMKLVLNSYVNSLQHSNVAYILASSIVAFSISGAIVGMSLGNMSHTISLLAFSPINLLGYTISKLFQGLGYVLFESMTLSIDSLPNDMLKNSTRGIIELSRSACLANFKLAGTAIHEGFATLALFLANATNLILNITAGLIGSAIFIVGAVLGVLTGSLSLSQLLVVNSPFVLPFDKMFSFFIDEAKVSLNTRAEIEAIEQNAEINGTEIDITIINTLDDSIVLSEASLNQGLGFEPPKFESTIISGKLIRNTQEQLNASASLTGIKSIWYQQGNHVNAMSNPVKFSSKDNIRKNPDDAMNDDEIVPPKL